VPRPSILTDELLRQLVAVGQVDILVGVPSFNNAATIEPVVRAIHVGLAKHFPRERTVLLNADSGSDDGTRELVRNAPMADEEMRGSPTLRTTHRVSAVSPGTPERASTVRAVFAAADLLQARAVVIVDADVTSMTADWVADLARPIWKNDADFVTPIHPRHRFEGPLLGQIVRPLLGTAYARRLHSSVIGDFACSGQFAAGLVRNEIWDRDPTRPALDVWLVAAVMAQDLRLVQTHLGPCVFGPRSGRAGLAELFEQVVGTTLASLVHDAPAWLPREEMKEVPTIGTPCEPAGEAADVDPAPWAARFHTGVRDLAPLLRDILAPETLGRLQEAAQNPLLPSIPDSLWAATLFEFAASTRRGVMSREHLTQALVPLYLGRAASFFAEIVSVDEPAYQERLATLDREFEGMRPYLVERWNSGDGR